MNPILVGLIAGVLFGCVDVALMLPMDFPDKKAALIAAFCSRFAIGFLIPLIRMPIPPCCRRCVGRIADQLTRRHYHQILRPHPGQWHHRRRNHRMGRVPIYRVKPQLLA